MVGMTANIYTGLSDFEEMGFLLHFLRSSDTFFDVGANVGVYTILASGVCGARSVAFEPIISTHAHLQKNIELNDLGKRITPIRAAAGSHSGELCFTQNEDTTNHVVSSESETSVNVPCVRIDEYYFNQPALIKIDVEGFETEVLNGAGQLLKDNRLKAIIIELNGSGERYGYDEKVVHEKLIGNGFSPVKYNPYERSIIPLRGPQPYNTLYLRDIASVRARVEEGPVFTVFRTQI